MRIEDKIIINEIKNGNKVVYESLFSDYYESLVSFAEKYTFDQQVSEDIVQELFIYVWEKASVIEIKVSLKAYFYQAIRNKCLNYLKSIKVQDKNNLLYIEAVIQGTDDADLYDPELVLQIKEAIDELPSQMAKVFKLKILNGLKQEEIAEELNISVNSVKTHLKRARTKLRETIFQRTNLHFLL